MIISKSKKFIFIHINKNGGTSVRAALEPYHDNRTLFYFGEKMDRKFRRKIPEEHRFDRYGIRWLKALNPLLPMPHKFVEHHDPVNILKPSEIKDYYKFAIIREPADRLISMYFHELTKEFYPLHSVASKGFDYYVDFVFDQDLVNKQTDLISIDGQVILDDAILFDNIEQDFSRICKHLHIPNAHLPHENEGKKRKEIDINSDLIPKIEQYFADDFALYEQFKNKNR